MVDNLENKGKEGQFFRLLSKHQADIYSYIISIVPIEADADDIYQETCAVMWRKFDEFKPGTYFSSWGRKIAYYILLEHRRKASQNPIAYSMETLEFISSAYIEHQKDKDRRLEILNSCLKNLTEKERYLIELKYMKLHSIEEIAKQFSVSVNMIYKLLAKSYYFLYECIQQNIAVEERT